MHEKLVSVTDADGIKWDVVFVFDGEPESWAEKLATEGYWQFLSWGGVSNAIGFRWVE